MPEQPLTTNQRIDRLQKTIIDGFTHADERCKAIEERFESMQSLVLELRAAVIQRLDHLSGRLDLLVPTMQSLDERIPGLTKAVHKLLLRLDKLELPPHRASLD